MASPTHDGGKPEVKPIEYCPPVGPTSINNPKTPGLHGENLGSCGTQQKG
jgi:hypothetical protein